MRATWAMTMFYLIMSALMIGVKTGNDCRRGLQNGYGLESMSAVSLRSQEAGDLAQDSQLLSALAPGQGPRVQVRKAPAWGPRYR